MVLNVTIEMESAPASQHTFLVTSVKNVLRDILDFQTVKVGIFPHIWQEIISFFNKKLKHFIFPDCDCNPDGSDGIDCDKDGKCSCNSAYIFGDKCEKCVEGFFEFPNCIGRYISQYLTINHFILQKKMFYLFRLCV